MIWVVCANSSECNIYAYDKKAIKLTTVKKLSHPESKLKGREITSDGPGHYQAAGTARGSYAPDETPQSQEANNFARQIAMEVETGRTAHEYEKLILVTPPAMQGLLNQHLKPQVQDLILKTISKNYMSQNLKESEMLDIIVNALKLH